HALTLSLNELGLAFCCWSDSAWCLNGMVLSLPFGLAFAALSLWCLSLIILRYAYPVYFDGAEPMPSFFYWGRLPGMAEYHSISCSTSCVSYFRTALRPLSSHPFVCSLLPNWPTASLDATMLACIQSPRWYCYLG